MKIYSYPNNPRVAKALIAANYNDVKIDVPTFTMGVENKTPEFTKKSPTCKVPVLETSEGCIFESNAIARYVARLGNAGLYGQTTFESGQVDMWIDWAANELDPHTSAYVGQIFQYLPFNPAAAKKAKESAKAALMVLNSVLANKTFLVGEQITLADIIVSISINTAFRFMIDAPARTSMPHVVRYFFTCVLRPEFAPLGEVQLCEAAVEPEAPKKEEKKKEEKPAAAAAAPAKKEEKKPAKKEEDEAEDDGEEAAAPKPKNPLDLLPPAKMNMDEWKRKYSNADTRTEALPWLWENFDAEGYSWYECKYKYNNELTMTFMTSNLIGGFFQRLDEWHKYSFGSMVIMGQGNSNHEVRGVWMLRGKELPEGFKAVEDFQVYDWKPLDHTDAATQERINDFLSWDKPIEDENKVALPFISGKIFK